MTRRFASSRTLRHAAFLLAMAALAGCGAKWAELEFDEAGFAASFPQPVQSRSADKSTEYWGWTGDLQAKVIRTTLGSGGTKALGGANAVLAAYYEQIKEFGRELSPPRGTRLQDRYPALDYHIEAKFPDGSNREVQGRAVVSGDQIYVISASWPPGDKSGAPGAERFISSFRFLK